MPNFLFLSLSLFPPPKTKNAKQTGPDHAPSRAVGAALGEASSSSSFQRAAAAAAAIAADASLVVVAGAAALFLLGFDFRCRL
jgi:hypothetical protein